MYRNFVFFLLNIFFVTRWNDGNLKFTIILRFWFVRAISDDSLTKCIYHRFRLLYLLQIRYYKNDHYLNLTNVMSHSLRNNDSRILVFRYFLRECKRDSTKPLCCFRNVQFSFIQRKNIAILSFNKLINISWTSEKSPDFLPVFERKYPDKILILN